MYIETSSPRVAGDNASLVSTTAGCGIGIDFAYNMNGATTGSLTISSSASKNGPWIAEWTLAGNQGVAWQHMIIGWAGHRYVKITGVRGSSYTGDIAIDTTSVLGCTPAPTKTPTALGQTYSPTVVPTPAPTSAHRRASTQSCNRILVSGATLGATDQMGIYVKQAGLNDGKSVFKIKKNYLYYYSSNGYWHINNSLLCQQGQRRR